MENEKLRKAFEKQVHEQYYTPKELEYGNVAGTYLSPFEYGKLVEYKESIALSDNEYVCSLPFPAFSSKCLFFVLCDELKSLLTDYVSLASESGEWPNDLSAGFLNSRIYSEIEGTLNIESVPTTRRRLKDLLENDAPATEKNDIIIKNMKAGIDFVNKRPPFNEENLFRLYSLLSMGCLGEEDKLLPGKHYRHDGVEVSRYHGCPQDQIEANMNSLFDYVNNKLGEKRGTDVLLLPHLCHYYILYIHPYFDYNGRTARMASYWVHLLSGLDSFPPILSEAINQTKNEYYRAIELSRDSHNDLTYFLKYLLSVSIDYDICYQNLRHLEQISKNHGFVLTETELHYIKRILMAYKGAFNYSDFLRAANVSMSKQGALKTLNKLVDCGALVEIASSSKTKLFDINKSNIPYAFKYFGYTGK